MSYELCSADLEPLLLGGAFFGSGGGGTITSARHLASNFYKGILYPTDTVQIVTVREATEGDAVMVAYMGAPEAINSTTYPVGPIEAVRQIQQKLELQGRKLAYVVSPESGALGFVVAILVAAKLGLKVIDADGAGRAVPSLPMLTYASSGINPSPAFLANQNGLSIELNVAQSDTTQQQDLSSIVEQITRPIISIPQFGEFGGLAMWVMKSTQLSDALPIRGTLTRALELGQALQANQISTADAMIDFLATQFGITAYRISQPGQLLSADVDTAGGFDVGKINLKAEQKIYTVEYQNESLLVWDSMIPHPVVLAPDSIAYFADGLAQNVFSNGDLVMADGSLNPELKDRNITLLAWQAEPELCKPGGLILSSFLQQLRNMGYSGPYVPIASLLKKTKGSLV
jgi:uncharacterized protein